VLAREHSNVDFIYPVHLNPNVREPVYRRLGKYGNVYLIEPQEYAPFVWLMDQSDIILTDSGGIQEEAPSLNKPVFVLRDVTERPEAVSAGTVRLVGTSPTTIISNVNSILRDSNEYRKMAYAINPFGDGTASRKIVDFLSRVFPKGITN
jgi:UDP-N-acetylglucosamine 2-epimerase (non-hydrolysing)